LTLFIGHVKHVCDDDDDDDDDDDAAASKPEFF